MTQRILRGRVSAVLAVPLAISASTLTAPPPAAAHPDPTLQVRLVSVEPALPEGIRVDVLDGDQTLLGLSNPSASEAVVLDPEGDPFLTVSSQGVFGDLRSPFLAASRTVVEGAVTPPRGCCPEDWKLLSKDPRWVWPDPRLDPPLRKTDSDGSRGLGALSQSAPLGEWSLSIQVGDRTSLLEGVVERRQVGAVTTTIEAAPPELDVSVVDSMPPQLRVDLRAATRIGVVGADGRPFIKVDVEGAFGRRSSSEYQSSRSAMGLPPIPGSGWMRVAAGGPSTVTWADMRVDFRSTVPPADAEGPVVLGHWRIPIVVDGRPDEILGESVWTPEPVPEIALDQPRRGFWDAGGGASYALAGGLTVALLAAILLARRRAGRVPS